MKLARALAVAAKQLDVPPEQLRAIARTLSERQAGTVEKDRCAEPLEDGAATEVIDPAGLARSLSRSLQASHSLLTRTINLLK
jgi:hypothetical protein